MFFIVLPQLPSEFFWLSIFILKELISPLQVYIIPSEIIHSLLNSQTIEDDTTSPTLTYLSLAN